VLVHCSVPENIHTPPTKGIGISWGVGGSVRPKNLKKCMKLNRNFQRGGGDLEKFPSVGEVWIFSGTTHLIKRTSNPTSFPISAPRENRIMKLVSKKISPNNKPFKTMFLHCFIGIGSGVCLKFDDMELNLITLYASNK